MVRTIDLDDPERAMAVMTRNRKIKVFAVVTGIVLALGTLFMFATAMYNADPVARALDATAK
jgi:hypothetical protein